MKKTNESRQYLILAVIAVLAIASIATVVYYQTRSNNDENLNDSKNQYSFKNVEGNHLNFSYSNIKEGIQYIPEGAFCVNIIKIKENGTIHNYLEEIQPGINATEIMVGHFETGAVEYYVIDNEHNATIMIDGNKPEYEGYNGYNYIVNKKLSFQRLLTGNPFLILTAYDGTIEGLGKDVIDVISSDKKGTKDFDNILIYADDVSDYENLYVYMVDETQKYYHRSSSFENGSFQFEVIVLNPNTNIRDNLIQMTQNKTETISYNVTETGNIMKIYINGENESLYLEKTQELYNIVFSEYNHQLFESSGMLDKLTAQT